MTILCRHDTKIKKCPNNETYCVVRSNLLILCIYIEHIGISIYILSKNCNYLFLIYFLSFCFLHLLITINMLITRERLYNSYIVILGTTVNINLYYIKVLNKTKGLTPLDKESAQGIACVFYLNIRLGKDNHDEYECIDASTLGHLISHWSRDEKSVKVNQQHINMGVMAICGVLAGSEQGSTCSVSLLYFNYNRITRQNQTKSKKISGLLLEMKKYHLANELEQDIACFSYSASDTEYQNLNTNMLLNYKYG